MIVPTRWALIAMFIAAAPAALAAVDGRFTLLALGLDAAVLALVGLEGWWLGRRRVVVRRAWVGRLQSGRPATLQWTIENRDPRRTLRLTWLQPWPAGWTGDAGPWSVHLRPMERAVVSAVVTPRRRGDHELPAMELDVTLPAALAAHRRAERDGAGVTVYPSLVSIAAYEKLRRSRALTAAGFHLQRMVGAGREFDQLRDYIAGDDYRDINWKATGRFGRPQTNLYRAERSRDVMICVEGGRMMGNPVGTRTAVDYAVDAALLLAHACRDAGDRVGLITFRDRVDTVLRAGATTQAVMRTLARFDARPVFPHYLALAEALRINQSRRALVLLLTDLSDPQLAADLAGVMPLLRARHLVVVIALRDTLIDAIAHGPADAHGVDRVLAARTIVGERDAHSAAIRKAGVDVLHADAERLSLAAVNHYMQVKARQLV